MNRASKKGIVIGLISIVLIISILSLQFSWYTVSDDITYQDDGDYDFPLWMGADEPESIDYRYTTEGKRIERTTLYFDGSTEVDRWSEDAPVAQRETTTEMVDYEEEGMDSTASVMGDMEVLTYVSLGGSLLLISGLGMVAKSDENYRIGVILGSLGLGMMLVAPVYFPFQVEDMFGEDDHRLGRGEIEIEAYPEDQMIGIEEYEEFETNIDRSWMFGSAWFSSLIATILGVFVLKYIVKAGSPLGNRQRGISSSYRDKEEKKTIKISNPFDRIITPGLVRKVYQFLATLVIFILIIAAIGTFIIRDDPEDRDALAPTERDVTVDVNIERLAESQNKYIVEGGEEYFLHPLGIEYAYNHPSFPDEKVEEYEVKVREHLESFIDSSSTNAELTFHLTAGRKRYIDTLQADIRLENPDGINCVSSSLLQEGLAYVPEESEDVSDDYRYLWREEEAIREGKNLWGFIEDGYI